MGNNATLLSWIVAEVDQALTLVRDQIAKFSAGSGDAALLASCPVHLHQVSGALRMVGLAGATRFCELIEQSFAAPAGAAALAVVDRAIQALKEFVDGLERGQANVPLRLFPLYRELATLQGKLDVSERDLFFPDLSPPAPPHTKPKALAMDRVSAHVQKQRALFQRGLLAWLRNSTKGGLDDMRRAVNQLHKVAAQLPEPQAVWWVAGGLIDSLEHPQSPEWVAQAKALGNRIEKQMREGSPAVSEVLLRELLYAVAKAQAPSKRVTQVRQLYQLDSLFPEPPKPAGMLEFDLDWLEPALYDLHSRLDALKGAWVQYVAGEQKTATRFRELVAPFKTKAVPLGNQHLIKLLDAIALVTKHLPDPFPRQKPFMVIEMASAFLLIESVIDHFTDPPPDLEQQIVIMGGWLLDAAQGKSTGEPPAGLRADLSEQIGALQLRARVAKEIAANLQHVEQVLDAFARDPSKRDTLRGLQSHLRQINGALTVLRFEQAARAFALCERLIKQCSSADYANVADDMDWIAEGLSSIGIFLEPCQQGREPAEHAIELFFRRHDRAHTPVLERGMDTTMVLSASAIKKAAASAAEAKAPAASVEPPVPVPAPPAPAPAPARSGVDRELLDIYLDEAGEVLGNIQAAMVECRAQPQDLDVLTTIRRGFHTLKGSGRMVGLMDLGEVAWEVEQVMNRWLQMKWPASAELLDLLTRASTSFTGWIAQLRDGSLAGEIKAQDIVALAAKLRAAEEPAEVAPAAAPAEPVANPALEATALPEEVMVGEVRLARHMFDIYLKEAREHVAMLQGQYDAWRDSPGEAAREFVRAAHTLASSSQTAGFASIASLSAALEQWMPLASQSAAAADAKLVKKAIKGLRERVESVDRRVAPAQSGKTEAALRQLTARLLALPVPAPAPVSAPLPAQAPVPEAAPTAEMPAPAPAAAGGRAQRVMRDDIDPQLLPIFLEEAQHLLPLVGSDLRDWKAHPEDEKVLQSLQRALHTLKGSARMAGAIRLGELTHVMESRIEAALEAGEVSAPLFVELEEKMDRLSLDLERMAAPEPAAEAQPAAAAAATAAEAPRAEPPLPSPAAMLRINADTLDHLINESGEVTIARTRVEAELRGVKQSIVDLSESIARLRAQLREVEIQADSQMQARKSELEERNREFDPLEFDRYTRLQELTRLMAESLHDAASIQQSLSKNLGETDAALIHQARTSRDVQQELMRMRAVPFSILDERLYRIVRQTTRELDKKAELHIEGSQVEMDRSVLERIGAPLEHMLRNALSHGLETPAARVAAGKPEAGRLSVSLRQEGNEIALIVSDDGAGLDLERLRRKAEDKGLLQAGQEVAETELMQLIFVSGLSTAEAVTELAGRGIGMDVVRNEIAAAGGRVDIASERGRGTTFTIYLPLTLAVTQAVLVRAGGAVLAVSAAMVEQVLRLKAEALAERYAAQSVEFQDRRYPLYGLAQLLGASAGAVQTYNSVLLLRSGVQRIALHVDEMLGQHEIVVKNIGPQLARVPGAAGATVLADGSIVLIVNPVQLVQHARVASERTASPAAAPVAVAPAAPAVMVVDDSLTVRKITSRLLEREGYQVLTAKDGLDALAQMKDALPDVMLVDIEMPRMDGFDLTRNLRGDPRTRGMPIIMISSRTAEKHRSQAVELGVNVFLGKPYPEAELLQHIAGYIKDRKR
ncbi:MAG TPA: Hpt domain-containing protein [Burkholderiales bacterium]|jgi:chemosensory pili system protein ChpA (sensor histidine kinase/response regulator)